MNASTDNPAARTRRVAWPYAVAAVLLVVVVVAHRSHVRAREQRELRAQQAVFAPQLWNLESERAAQTARIILQSDRCDAIRVDDSDGGTFIEVKSEEQPGTAQSLLRSLGLVWTTELHTALRHGDERIGTLRVVRVDRSIYLYGPAAVFLLLCAFLSQVLARNIQQERQLTETNLRLEKGRRKDAEIALLTREAQLQEVRRLETLGRLAGGLAHDFNNLLTVISCGTEALLASPEQSQNARATLKSIEDASLRASRMTQQLLAFSRRQEVQPEPLVLNEIVANMQSMLSRLIGGVELVAKLDPELLAILGNPSEMEQVIMNLVLNARDAIDGAGTITLETTNGDARDGTTPQVLLRVTDTGKGMSEQERERAFEPFFSTKGDKGTGLGLSTVDSIVRGAGGTIEVDSKPDRGTRIELRFPSSRTETTTQAAPGAGPAPVRGNRLLIVEDQEMIRNVMVEGLRRKGFSVQLAADGDAGVQALMSAVPPFDLVITDLNLPGKSGLELCRVVESQRPQTRVLCMSGHIAQDDDAMSYPLLAKPFTIGQLLDRVEELLGPGSD